MAVGRLGPLDPETGSDWQQPWAELEDLRVRASPNLRGSQAPLSWLRIMVLSVCWSVWDQVQGLRQPSLLSGNWNLGSPDHFFLFFGPFSRLAGSVQGSVVKPEFDLQGSNSG